MPPKKKSKPSFKVPEDLESAPQAGWVYRSEPTEARPKAAPPAEETKPVTRELRAVPAAIEPEPRIPRQTWEHEYEDSSESDDEDSSDSSFFSSDILELSAKTFSSGMSAFGNALMLGAAFLTVPLRIGMWVVGLRDRD